MEKQHRGIALVLRISAVLIALMGVVMALLPPSVVTRQPQILVWAGLVLCLGACVALIGLATLLRRQAQVPPEVHSALSRIQHQVMDLQVKLNDLYLMSDRAARATHVAVTPPKDYTEELQQLAAAIAEIRELSLLPDSERRQRADVHQQTRRADAVHELFALIGSQEWAKAERMLISLQAEYPNDEELVRGRNYLDHSRKLVEQQTLQQTTREIEEAMRSNAWRVAWDKAQNLVEGFPTNGTARTLQNRVQKEYENYCDSTTQRMLESIRHHIDQRNWRNALDQANQLIQQFPDHRLAETLRMQMKTLRDNAEIQERQELEVRIQELIHDGQFAPAIELAEDVLRRFPNSPQADSLETLLPRIRELAEHGAETPGAAQ